MSILAKTKAVTFSLLAFSTLAVAGDPGPEGVPVDLSTLTGEPAGNSAAADAADAAAGAAATVEGVTDSAGNAIDGLDTTSSRAAAEAAARETMEQAANEAAEAVGEAFDSVMEALTPAEPVAPLGNDRVEVYVSDQVAFAKYERSAIEIERLKLEEARVHLGFLYSEGRDTVFQGGLAADTAITRIVRLSFGARGYVGLLGDENEDTFAAAVGVEAAYKLPFERLPLELAASIYYAPDILTFGSSDRIIDTRFGVSLPVRPQLSIFGGARFLQFDTRPGDEEVDNQIHLGARWDFRDK